MRLLVPSESEELPTNAKLRLMKILLYSFEGTYLEIEGSLRRSGVDSYRVPPVPIPNTVVKPIYAESTWMETSWEDR